MKVKCELCGKNIYRSAYRLRDYEHQYCSKNCADQALIKPKKMVSCLQCSKEIHYLPSRDKYGGRKFCSTECAVSFRTNPIVKNCLICNKEIFLTPSKIKHGRGKYCSMKCSHEAQKGPNGTRAKHGYGIFKKFSQSIENKKCELCKSEKQIDLHHKDGDKFNNKKSENWILLCRKCHLRLHSLIKKFDITPEDALKILEKNKLWELTPHQFSNYAPED